LWQAIGRLRPVQRSTEPVNPPWIVCITTFVMSAAGRVRSGRRREPRTWSTAQVAPGSARVAAAESATNAG
jgi:hypothetical protein